MNTRTLLHRRGYARENPLLTADDVVVIVVAMTVYIYIYI